MKKIFTFLFLAGMMHQVQAQSGTIQPVPYRGAFAPAPTPMWTEGWVNWDPQNAVYPATNVSVSGNITTNTTWMSSNTYLLNGPVYVNDGVTLTIMPGTVIRGALGVGSALIVKKGGKVYAQGTAANPIVFTSNSTVGNRQLGDWGGIILLGKAAINPSGGVANIEGLPIAPENSYGGGLTPDDNDNSGALQYVRIEFGGYVYQPNQEINGLTMGGVGRGTMIDHIQCSFINDDSFEWFGGTVNATHLISYRTVDDGFDTDFGWSGKVQFGLIVRDPSICDPTYNLPSGSSTSEGFESDNDASGSTNTPKTSGIFTNVTVIGPYRGVINDALIEPCFRRAARIRRNSELKIFNSILMDYPRGLMIDGSAAENNATNGLLKFKNNIIAGSNPARYFEVASGSTYDIRGFFNANGNDSLQTTANLLISPYNFLTPDYRPTSTSPALSNVNTTDPAFTTCNDFTLPVSFVSFRGETVKGVHSLLWETKTEQNNSGFDLERSTNGQQFSSIGFIASKAINGNSISELSYNFEDAKPFSGITYYRLKQVDKDGRYAYSNVVALQTGNVDVLTFGNIYPNPSTNGVVRMVVVSPEKQNVDFRITDVSGRIMNQRNISLNQGINNLEFNVQNFNSGNYFIQAVGTGIKPQQFVKLN